MRIIRTKIPSDSHEIAVWQDLPPGDVDTGEPIDLVCNLHHLNQHECLVTKAKGVLSDEINIGIGFEAMRAGYRVMHYTVAAGSKSSRHGVYQKTVNGLDYYTVDLEEAASKL